MPVVTTSVCEGVRGNKRDKNQKEEIELSFSGDRSVFVQSLKESVGKSLELLRQFAPKLDSEEHFVDKSRTLEKYFPR